MMASTRSRDAKWIVALLASAVILLPAPARCEEHEEDELRGDNMPEPILVETPTDIDSAQAGEVEIDLLGGVRLPWLKDREWGALLEVEWRVLDEVGVSAEVGYSRDFGTGDLAAVGERLSLAWSFFHDPARDLHLMLVGSARVPMDIENEAALDPAEPALPISFGLHGAQRFRFLTLRAEATGEGGGHAHRLPLRAAAAALAGVPGLGFAGVEVMADWARPSPWSIAAELSFDARAVDIPCLIGVAVPWRPDVAPFGSSTSLVARIVVEL
jgi:hypothetical protein